MIPKLNKISHVSPSIQFNKKKLFTSPGYKLLGFRK